MRIQSKSEKFQLKQAETLAKGEEICARFQVLLDAQEKWNLELSALNKRMKAFEALMIRALDKHLSGCNKHLPGSTHHPFDTMQHAAITTPLIYHLLTVGDLAPYSKTIIQFYNNTHRLYSIALCNELAIT